MERKIIKTADGSVSIHLPEWDESYHSRHGAVQEALHVFIKMGLHYFLKEKKPFEISILEIGFGTGLNAFITFLESEKHRVKINYTGVEAYPVGSGEISALNYPEILLAKEKAPVLWEMHQGEWEKLQVIGRYFSLYKHQKRFEELSYKENFNIIYFDAFGARVQPELWSEEIFQIMFKALQPQGVLVTYSAKGSVRRNLQKVGFVVERLPGPPGKREMLRAVKNKV